MSVLVRETSVTGAVGFGSGRQRAETRDQGKCQDNDHCLWEDCPPCSTPALIPGDSVIITIVGNYF